jgi:hypothetical protein
MISNVFSSSSFNLRKRIFINHFPMSVELSQKGRLYKTLMATQNPFFPESFVLPEQKGALLERLTLIAPRVDIQDADSSLWIVKPLHSGSGRNIRILTDEQLQKMVGSGTGGGRTGALKRAADGYVKSRAEKKEERAVISKYIHNPLLIHGHKFDLRLYVVVTSFSPLSAYICREGFVRFASQAYTKSTDAADLSNQFVHLTNNAINKRNQKRKKAHSLNWSLGQLELWMASHGMEFETVWDKVKALVRSVLLSVQAPITKAQTAHNVQGSTVQEGGDTSNSDGKPCIGNGSGCHCFEVFGFDVLIDASLNVWTLEVNGQPALGVGEILDKTVDTFMLTHLLDILHPLVPSKTEGATPKSSDKGKEPKNIWYDDGQKALVKSEASFCLRWGSPAEAGVSPATYHRQVFDKITIT